MQAHTAMDSRERLIRFHALTHLTEKLNGEPTHISNGMAFFRASPQGKIIL